MFQLPMTNGLVSNSGHSASVKNRRSHSGRPAGLDGDKRSPEGKEKLNFMQIDCDRATVTAAWEPIRIVLIPQKSKAVNLLPDMKEFQANERTSWAAMASWLFSTCVCHTLMWLKQPVSHSEACQKNTKPRLNRSHQFDTEVVSVVHLWVIFFIRQMSHVAVEESENPKCDSDVKWYMTPSYTCHT